MNNDTNEKMIENNNGSGQIPLVEKILNEPHFIDSQRRIDEILRLQSLFELDEQQAVLVGASATVGVPVTYKYAKQWA